MATLGDVKATVRGLVGDPFGDFTTDAYLLPLINQAYKQAIGALEDMSANPFVMERREALAVPAGVTDFIALSASGKPFDGLLSPDALMVKQAGQAPEYYREVRETLNLPNVSPYTAALVGPAAFGAFAGSWEYRTETMYITPFAYPCDFQLRGEFRPAALVLDTDQVRVHLEMDVHLAYSTSALVGIDREHPSWVSEYGGLAAEVFDRIASKMVKQDQGKVFRFGSTSRRARRR